MPLELCPSVSGHIDVHHSAVAIFYAPSDESGHCGMKREQIHSSPSWRNQGERRDCALVVLDDSKLGMKGMSVVKIRLLFSFVHGNTKYPCALVDWFKTYGAHPDRVTGMWRVVPETFRGHCFRSVVHLDTLLHSVHLVPAFDGARFLPSDFDRTHTLLSFTSYYVNKYGDHHAHEIIY